MIAKISNILYNGNVVYRTWETDEYGTITESIYHWNGEYVLYTFIADGDITQHIMTVIKSDKFVSYDWFDFSYIGDQKALYYMVGDYTDFHEVALADFRELVNSGWKSDVINTLSKEESFRLFDSSFITRHKVEIVLKDLWRNILFARYNFIRIEMEGKYDLSEIINLLKATEIRFTRVIYSPDESVGKHLKTVAEVIDEYKLLDRLLPDVVSNIQR